MINTYGKRPVGKGAAIRLVNQVAIDAKSTIKIDLRIAGERLANGEQRFILIVLAVFVVVLETYPAL